jgi:hypothetical protein
MEKRVVERYLLDIIRGRASFERGLGGEAGGTKQLIVEPVALFFRKCFAE